MPFWPSLEPCAKLTPVQVGDQDAADPPAGRLVAFGRGIQRRIADDELQHQQQDRRHAEAEQRREQQRVADLGRLAPVDARGAVAAAHQRIGDADADDRADQRVRRGRRQAEIPGAEVPDDGRNQQREHHGEAGAASDLQDQFHRQQRDDAEGDRAGREQHAEEIEEARPHHGEFRRQRMGVDHGRDRVGGVVETVDEFEAERDQERHEQQDVGQEGGDPHAGGVDVGVDAVGDEQQSGGEDAEEQDHGQRIETLVQVRPGGRLDGRRVGYRWIECNIGHSDAPSEYAEEGASLTEDLKVR